LANLSSTKLYFATLLMTLLAACGQKEKAQSGETLPAVVAGVPVSPELSRVPFGSREVVSFPPAGPSTNVLFVQLFGEPGSDIRYSFRDPALAGELPLAGGQKYSGALVIWPPASVWAMAIVKGEAGPVRRFDFPWVSGDGQSLPVISGTRFPLLSDPASVQSFRDLPLTAPEEVFDAVVTGDVAPDPSGILQRAVDGKVTDLSPGGRTFGRDARGDMPQPAADVVYGAIAEDSRYFHLVIATAERPRTDKEVVYGVEIGPANVSFSNFGHGAETTYTIMIDGGRLTLDAKGKKMTLGPESVAFVGDVVEMRVARADLPLLQGVPELTARPFAMLLTGGVKTADRMRPLYLRSRFLMARATAGLFGGRTSEIALFTDPQYGASILVPTLLGQMKDLLPQVELLHQMPLYETGTTSLFYASKDANGYTGLNAFDRGLLTTLGPSSSAIEHAQLVAHELAHYHNALGNRITTRWFQEGMSEWSAERLLYKHFPRRAVQQYVRKLRFDHYWSVVGSGNLDDLPLSRWEGTATDLGYSKSLMFFDLLEARVGADPIRKLQQYGVNANLDTAGIKLFLEQESGQNLDGLFQFWVTDGEPAAENDPRKLFKDEDGDGLLGLEEEILGTSDLDVDSDKDGYGDDEEFARGSDPNVAQPQGSSSGSLEFRLAGAAGSEFLYSFDPENTLPLLENDPWARTYHSPTFFHAPYKIVTQSRIGGLAGATNIVNRPLYVNGAEVPTPHPGQLILPPVPQTSSVLPVVSFSGLVGKQITDSAYDVQDDLAAYNITGVHVSLVDQVINVEMTTKAAPDIYGSFGGYYVSFKNLEAGTSGPPQVKNRLTISAVAGAVHLHTFDEMSSPPGAESVTRVSRDQYAAFGTTLKIGAPLSDLQSWMASSGTKLICPYSTFSGATAGGTQSDHTGCLVYDAPSHQGVSASGSGIYGTGAFSAQVLIPAIGFVQADGEEFAQLTVGAVQAFEKALARPLIDRSVWTTTLKYVAGNSALGTAQHVPGAYLEFNPGTAPAASRRYLFVEQLARLVLADYLDRQKSTPPYWVQEFFVQWLTSSALYQMYPTCDPHSHTQARFGHYRCSTEGGCTLFDSDEPLDGWGVAPAGALNSPTGPVKSMMFALEVDALLGSQVMSGVMQTFSHRIPLAAELRALFLNALPAKASQINSIFDLWVVGTGNKPGDAASIRATFTDADGDGLLLFEESALGLNPTVADPYLN